MRVYLEFLGCRLNEAELSTSKRQFLAYNDNQNTTVQIVQHPEDADYDTEYLCCNG